MGSTPANSERSEESLNKHHAIDRSPGSLPRKSRIRFQDPSRPRLEHFPDFLFLGPQRTGTTWLFHNLKKHPQIFLPRAKETYYFSTIGKPDHRHYHFDTVEEFLDEFMRDQPRRWLKRQYDCLRKYREIYRPKVRGESTATNALIETDVIRDITAIRPGLKAILMLRHPVERAWSHARKDLIRKYGRRPGDLPREEFERFFRASGQRALASYTQLIRRWGQHLKPGHLFVGEFEMIRNDPGKLMTGVHRFLGVRAGEKYFNRHLRERINSSEPTSKRPSNRPRIPPEYREHLSRMLDREIRQYDLIKAALNPASPAVFRNAIHELRIDPVTSPAVPDPDRLVTAA